MSGEGEDGEGCEKPFYVDRAKTGRAACKKCKEKIGVGELRIGKLSYNPFASGTMKLWHHVGCMQEVFKKQRKTTKKIDNSSDIGGWDAISKDDKEAIKNSLDWYLSPEELSKFEVFLCVAQPDQGTAPSKNNDDSFRVFRKICSELTNESSYLGKTAIVKNFFTKGSDGNGFKGDLQLWCRSLLPMAAKRVYNLQSKQLVKIFSEIFNESQDDMLEDLEKGDVAETIGSFFEKSSRKTPAKKAVLSLQEVDAFLEYLSKLTRETDQKDHFESILPKCTANDLKVIIRLIKHDLRINAGPKHILEALHTDAYQAFQTSRDLEAVVKNAMAGSSTPTTSSKEKGMKIGITLMTPVRPMLAEACKSVEFAMKRCPKGMYSEIKYDGERVQLHKKGDEFKYFSRSLKAVTPHKVSHFAKYIPLAFPHGKDLILDSEILMMDTTTGEPLPFGTLGKHKKAEFKDATVCLFVFDCIYFNGKSLINETMEYRRKVLRENMTEIPNHVMFSEIREIHDKESLEDMIEDVLRKGLEGLVLKPLHSIYEPGKRHWLKVKKDYLFGGAMADSADLVVLGAWYGTGKKGGIMSVFLMGCYDTKRNSWVTVTKVHGGHDDKTLESLQKELKMVKISQNVAKVPPWLRCSKTMVPDFITEDPKKSQVWEITGAEFTCNQVHTADGISIRFPRVTRIRKDKDWETATSLDELKKLYETSRDTSGFTLKGRKTKANEEDSKKTLKKKPVKNAKKKDDFIDDSEVETEVDDDEDEEEEDYDDEDSPVKRKPGKKFFQKRKEASKRKGVQDETDTEDEDMEKRVAGKNKVVNETPRSKKRKEEDDEDSPVKKNVDEKRKEASKKKGIQYKTDSEGEDFGKKVVDKKKEGSETPRSKKRKEENDDGSPVKKGVDEKRKEDSKRKGIQYETETEDEGKPVLDRMKEGTETPRSKKRKVLDSDDGTEIDSDETSTGKKREPKEKESRKDAFKREENDSSPVKKESRTEREQIVGTSSGVKRKSSDDKDTETGKVTDKGRKDGTPSPSKRFKVEDSSSKRGDKAKDELKQSDKDRRGGVEESQVKSPRKKRDEEKSKESEEVKVKTEPSSKRPDVDSGSETEIEEEPFSNSSEKIEMANELPEVFKNLVVFLHRKVPEIEKARRYVIAYGGTIYSEERNTTLENNKGKVTHVVYPSRKIERKVKLKNQVDRVRSVSIEWLWDSVRKVKRQDEHRYKVKES